MDTLLALFFVLVTIKAISKMIADKDRIKKEEALLERNPEAWERLKRLELEKKDRNRRAAGGAAAGIFGILVKLFFKK